MEKLLRKKPIKRLKINTFFVDPESNKLFLK